MSAGEGCEAAVTVRIRYGWAKFKECGQFLQGNRFPLALKVAAYNSYVRPAIPYGSEVWCLTEIGMKIYQKDSG